MKASFILALTPLLASAARVSTRALEARGTEAREFHCKGNNLDVGHLEKAIDELVKDIGSADGWLNGDFVSAEGIYEDTKIYICNYNGAAGIKYDRDRIVKQLARLSAACEHPSESGWIQEAPQFGNIGRDHRDYVYCGDLRGEDKKKRSAEPLQIE
ncbi:unnamed protein product [Periconia digitata]|uniref:Uncharacterized protein n=1 Tax=Periconia digitata TaxID=1303443 RepID=A0A9W4XZ71_9PLEO|nr:unnamed protein product [Periconia digitata]